MSCPVNAIWWEGSTNTALARITSRNGSGDATGIDGEGDYLEQADISAITCQVYDLSSATPTTDIFDDSVSVADIIIDTPITSSAIWNPDPPDSAGANLLHELPPTCFGTELHRVRAEYQITLADSTVFFAILEGEVRRRRHSVVWGEDGTNTLLGRLTDRLGSGDATGVNGEGNWLEPGDIDSITVDVYDLSSSDPTTATYSDTLTVADAVLSSPDETNLIWTVDGVGHNFRHNLPPSAFPTGDRNLEVKVTTTLSRGPIYRAWYEGLVCGVLAS